MLGGSIRERAKQHTYWAYVSNFPNLFLYIQLCLHNVKNGQELFIN